MHCLAGEAISWASRRQIIVAQSTAEAEFVAAFKACVEGQGIQNILIQEFPETEAKIRMFIDN